MNYNILLDEATQHNIHIIEKADFESNSDGLINGNVIGLSKKLQSDTQKACVLAEELGHYHTSVGDIIDLASAGNRKQEHRARLWAYNKLIGLNGIVSAYKAGCQNLYDMAEHLNVTEDFLSEALSCYKSKYGIHTVFDNYVIFFEPSLGVLELI